ncbi:hypothetical protein Tco_0588055 [Tanacetum coccineum]
MPKSAWTEKDQIDNFLKERRATVYKSHDSSPNRGSTSENPLLVKKSLVDPHGFEGYLKMEMTKPYPSLRFIANCFNAGYLKMEVKYMFQDFRYSDTERLSQSDEVLKLKNFKKDATLKLFKSTSQERYEHVGPEVTSSQDGKVTRWRKGIMLG